MTCHAASVGNCAPDDPQQMRERGSTSPSGELRRNDERTRPRAEHPIPSFASDDGVGFSMIAPPISKQIARAQLTAQRRAVQERWRNNAFRSARSDEDGGNPANIAASGASNQTLRSARAAARKG